MKKQSKISLLVPYYIIYLFIPCTLSYLFGIVLEVDMSNTSKLMYTLLIAISIKLFSLVPLLLFLMSILFILGIIIFNYYFPHSVKALIEWIWQFIWNILQHVQGKEDILKENAAVVWSILVILLCIFTYIAIFKIKKILFLIPLYYTFFIYYWYIYINQSYKMMIVFTFAIIILVSLKRYEDEKLNFKYRPWLKTAICYGIIAILAGQILPKADSILHWPWLENKTYDYFPILANMRTDGTHGTYNDEGYTVGIFSLQETGFNPEGSRLGGPVKQSNRQVMTVKAPYPIYLRGRVSETYLDNQWTTGKWNYNRQWLNKNLPKEVEEDDVVEISITYTNLSSNTAFTPYLPISITDIGGKTIFADENNQITVPSGIDKTQGYRVISVLPGATRRLDMERKFIRNHYLQLPSSISNEVYELSRTITKNINGSHKKALAIEDYLRKNYKYSLEVSYVPKGKEFVDYFLFEEKEGYCTYFATAMAVLLRVEGIPSRYVEGYQMPQQSKNGVYTITQKQAHAWVEAYIEGQGWIAFDPTPSLGTSIIEEDSSVGELEEDAVFSDEMDQEDTLTTINQNNGELKTDEQIELQNEKTTLENQSKRLSELFNLSKTHIISMTILSVFIWILLKASISYIYRKRVFRRIERLSINDSIIYFYNNILTMLEHIGHIRNNGETPYEYAQRISSRIHGHELDFRHVTDIYLKAKYSDITISKDEKDIITDYLIYIENKLKVKLGKWKYVYYKYFTYK